MTAGEELVERIQSDEMNAATLGKQLIHEEHNSAANWSRIVAGIEEGRFRDISLESKVKKTHAFIIGSGPSLDENIDLLRDWKGGIFCSTSQARTLVYYDAPPSHIVILDPFCCWDELKGIDWSKFGTKLVMQPGVWPDILEHWPNEVLLYRQSIGRRDTFYAQGQLRMYTRRKYNDALQGHERKRQAEFEILIPTELTQFACSPPTQMFAAAKLEYQNLFLMGVDFGFPFGKTRFTELIPDKEQGWIKDEQLFDAEAVKKNPNAAVSKNGVPTEMIHLYYKKNFLTAVRLIAPKTVVSTDGGIVDELRHADAELVIKRQGAGFRMESKKRIAERIEPYLAAVGCYVLVGKNGYSFVETKDPDIDLYAYMKKMLRDWKCDNCGAIGKAKDENSHAGETCPQCKTGKLEYANPIDIEANMRRIRRLRARIKKEVDFA